MGSSCSAYPPKYPGKGAKTMPIRQPIVSILGHVDHGKTTLLDTIRGTCVADRECGRITQHIGATEVPIDVIDQFCGSLMIPNTTIPGLLFIDTPGHHSFTTLRARGGALADLAVLIVDIMEGLKPQTIESLTILKRYQVPFVVAINKVDRINGWVSSDRSCFADAIKAQSEKVLEVLDEKLYKIVGQLFKEGYSADRYDRIQDFTRTIALVPTCARTGDGMADLLMILVGLAQRFLQEKLETEMEEGLGEGTVLEVKEEKGLGTSLDTIIFSGMIRYGDTIVVGGKGEPIVTRVKALLKPKPLDEIRDPQERFTNVQTVTAAAGVKIIALNLDRVIAGSPIKVVKGDAAEIMDAVRKETDITIPLFDQGILVKADAIGSLEAISSELIKLGIDINSAEVGDVSRRDVVDADTMQDPYNKTILAFNVNILPDAEEMLRDTDVLLLDNNIIYKLLEDYVKCRKDMECSLDVKAREEIVHPGKFKVLPDCIFRVSKPAVVGIRVQGGRIRVGHEVLRSDGRVIGRIQSIQSEKKSLTELKSGEEAAVALSKVTVGRQLKEEDVLFINIPEGHAKKLLAIPLNSDEIDILDTVKAIKRRENKFWGM